AWLFNHFRLGDRRLIQDRHSVWRLPLLPDHPHAFWGERILKTSSALENSDHPQALAYLLCGQGVQKVGRCPDRDLPMPQRSLPGMECLTRVHALLQEIKK